VSYANDVKSERKEVRWLDIGQVTLSNLSNVTVRDDLVPYPFRPCEVDVHDLFLFGVSASRTRLTLNQQLSSYPTIAAPDQPKIYDPAQAMSVNLTQFFSTMMSSKQTSAP
jgi:hypothetical protein